MTEGRELPSGIVTFVFTDIEGSTRLLRRLGERYSGLLDRHLTVMQAAWEAHGGHLIDTAGDGVFVAFDDADKAVDACADAQRRLCCEDWPADGELRSRMGIHTGLAAPHESSYRALAVHQAARVMSAAHGGQVLISAATAERLSRPDGVSILPLGRFRVRDFEAPVPLYQLTGPGLPSGFPAVRAVPADGHNLVAPPTSFHGREAEVVEVSARLRSGRLVTLAGLGGVGKTRLATEIGLRVAADWPDGAWLIDLAPIEDPALIAPAVAAALGVPSRGDDRWAEVLEHLAERQALVILDNCEGMWAECGRLVEELLARCPACALLATSRTPLGVPHEDLWRLGPLDVSASSSDPSPAVALFVDRAQAVHRGFVAGAEVLPAIVEICRKLDGLPLALELAAARMAMLSPGELLDALADRFGVLRSNNRALPERHRTLEAILDWSDHLLSAAERACLRRLAVFGAGFSIQGAKAAVSGEEDGSEVPDLVWSLVDKSLVTADLTASTTRYRLLESVREFAADRLREHDEVDATALRAAAWYGERLGPGRRHDRRWTGEVAVEIDNLRALVPMVAGTAPELSQELAFTIARYLDSIQSFREALDELCRHIDLLDVVTPAAVSLRTSLADLYLRIGDLSAAKEAVGDAEAMLHEAGSLPAWDELALERTRGELACRTGDFASAFDAATRTLAGDLSDPARARMLSQLGIAAVSLGDADTAAWAFERQLEAGRRIGDPVLEAPALTNLAEIALRRGDLSTAARHQQACLTLGLELGAPVMVAFSLIVAAHILAAGQEWAEAVTLHTHAESVLEATGLILYDEDRRQSEVMLGAARRHLGAEAYGDAHAAARDLDLPAAASIADHVLVSAAGGKVA